MMLLLWGAFSLLAAAIAAGAWGALAGFTAGAAVLLSPALWARRTGPDPDPDPGRAPGPIPPRAARPPARERVIVLASGAYRRVA
jgi:hypothetical protein